MRCRITKSIYVRLLCNDMENEIKNEFCPSFGISRRSCTKWICILSKEYSRTTQFLHDYLLSYGFRCVGVILHVLSNQFKTDQKARSKRNYVSDVSRQLICIPILGGLKQQYGTWSWWYIKLRTNCHSWHREDSKRLCQNLLRFVVLFPILYTCTMYSFLYFCLSIQTRTDTPAFEITIFNPRSWKNIWKFSGIATTTLE